MATPLEVKQIWTVLVTAYPYYSKEQAPTSLAQTLKLYQRLLADVPAEILETTALQHIATSKWFPAIGELRNAAVELAQPQHVTAIEGWGEVLAAMSDPRYYRYADGYHALPRFANPLTQRVVDAMGWGNLCASEDTTADRARFLQGYEALARRAVEERALLPITRELAQRLSAQRHAGQLEAGYVA